MGDVVVDGLAEALRALPSAGDDDARLARIRALEELKSAAAAAQAEITAGFVRSQRAEQRAAGVQPNRVDSAIAAQVARARRVSPHAAQRYVGWAMILTGELPETFDQLQAGRTSEWRAMLVARETAYLSRAHRAQADRDIAARLEHLGDRKVEAETRKLAYALDPEGALARTALAESERRVTLRPAPDAMTRLGSLLPAPQGVAVYTTLARDADTLIAIGQAGGRTRGQVMADLLVARLTGQDHATDVPVEINLIMTDTSLFHPDAPGGDEPATVVGVGPIPAGHARDLIHGPNEPTPRWLRRLYRSPETGELAAMDSRRRCFTPTQRHFIRLRDQGICAIAWCDAPIRHIDHITPHQHGGPTHVDNGQGLCAACNYAKQVATTTTTPPSGNPGHAPPEDPAA